jgi:hypothetical protein
MKNRPSPTDHNLPDEAMDALHAFIKAVPANRLSKTLRNLFLSNIYHELDTPSVDLEEHILDLQALFDFLDILEKYPAPKDSSFP